MKTKKGLDVQPTSHIISKKLLLNNTTKIQKSQIEEIT